jgi:hypothetical protein
MQKILIAALAVLLLFVLAEGGYYLVSTRLNSHSPTPTTIPTPTPSTTVNLIPNLKILYLAKGDNDGKTLIYQQYLRQNLGGERAFVVELTLPHLNSGTPKAHGHYSTFTMPSTNLDRDDRPPIQSYHLCPLRHDWTRDYVGHLPLGRHRR